MFATGQEWRFLVFCVQSAEEVWNANFMRIKGKGRERVAGGRQAGGRLKNRERMGAKTKKEASWGSVLGVLRQTELREKSKKSRP